MEGKKTTMCQELGDSRWDIIVDDKCEDLGEGVEALLVGRLVRGGEAIRLYGISKITVGAVCGTRFEGSQCLGHHVGGERDSGLVTGTVTCLNSVTLTDARRVKVLTQAFDMVCHIGHRESCLDPLVAGPVVVEVNEGSCLEAGVVIGCESDRGVLCWLEWDGENLVV